MKQGKAAVAWLKNRVRIVDLRAKGPPRHARHGEGRPAARRHRRCRTPGGAVVPSAGRTEAGRSHGSRRNGGRTAITRLARMGWSVGRSCARVWQSSATLTPLRQPGTWLGGNAMRRSGQQMAPARKRTTGTPRPRYERPPWQVSWLAGHRFCLAFPMPAGTSDTYSTDARRSQLRGQLGHGLRVHAPSDAPDSLLAPDPICGVRRTTTPPPVGRGPCAVKPGHAPRQGIRIWEILDGRGLRGLGRMDFEAWD